ncbi:hypothetical protein EVAR_82100_1 [Eumeta japonica]|uniref:Uncharacterized protein n=1 Tax=Eumeta variegata TaxID=151549 RepID=A0A4C1U247_EUMVA|nr:hypothetical protein EVAR_82100_1 [Eumeta japonica]
MCGIHQRTRRAYYKARHGVLSAVPDNAVSGAVITPPCVHFIHTVSGVGGRGATRRVRAEHSGRQNKRSLSFLIGRLRRLRRTPRRLISIISLYITTHETLPP